MYIECITSVQVEAMVYGYLDLLIWRREMSLVVRHCLTLFCFPCICLDIRLDGKLPFSSLLRCTVVCYVSLLVLSSLVNLSAFDGSLANQIAHG